jgi:hypothetical protein
MGIIPPKIPSWSAILIKTLKEYLDKSLDSEAST